MRARIFILTFYLIALGCFDTYSQPAGALPDSTLPFPTAVKQDQLLQGNPLAQYRALREMRERYLNSVFSNFYQELLKNFEEFLGFPNAGVEAMQLSNLFRKYDELPESPGNNYAPVPAIDIIVEKGEIIVFVLKFSECSSSF